MRRTLSAILVCGVVLAWAFQSKDGTTGAHLPAQAAADVLREAAGTDGAFLAARNVNETYDQANLASLMQYPTENIVVVTLTGKELRSAFERSVALYPQPNPSFLQISGFSVEFSQAGMPESRVQNVSLANGNPLDENRRYTIAMPLSLGRGGMGYFKIWDKSKITKELTITVEGALKGKRFATSSPRWLVRP